MELDSSLPQGQSQPEHRCRWGIKRRDWWTNRRLDWV